MNSLIANILWRKSCVCKRHTTHHVASSGGNQHWPGGTHLGQGGTYLSCGYPPWPRGTLVVGTYFGQGGPFLGCGYLPWPGGTYFGCGYPFWLGGTYLSQGVPTLAGMGYSPRCEQTDNITFPHPLDAGGNKNKQISYSAFCKKPPCKSILPTKTMEWHIVANTT